MRLLEARDLVPFPQYANSDHDDGVTVHGARNDGADHKLTVFIPTRTSSMG